MATYEIILKNDTKKNKSAVASTSANTNSSNKPKSNTKTEGSSSTLSSVVGVIAFNQVKSMAMNEISYQASTVQLRTGSSYMQQKVNYAVSRATSAVSFIALMGTGIATGNPLAIGSALLMPINRLLEIGRNQREINLKSSVENQSIERMSTRASSKGSRGGKYE